MLTEVLNRRAEETAAESYAPGRPLGTHLRAVCVGAVVRDELRRALHLMDRKERRRLSREGIGNTRQRQCLTASALDISSQSPSHATTKNESPLEIFRTVTSGKFEMYSRPACGNGSTLWLGSIFGLYSSAASLFFMYASPTAVHPKRTDQQHRLAGVLMCPHAAASRLMLPRCCVSVCG